MLTARGKGAVSGFLATRHHEARLTFDGLEIDQSYLHDTHRQLLALIADRNDSRAPNSVG